MIRRSYSSPDRKRRAHRPLAWGLLIAVVTTMTVAVSLLGAPLAQAHSGDQSYLYLDVGEGLAVEVHMPFVDLRDHVGFDLDGTDQEILDELERESARIVEYAREHTSFEFEGESWELLGGDVRRYREGEYVAVAFTLGGVPDEVPQEFDVQFDPFFDEDPSRDALFIVANDFARGIIGNDDEQFVRFLPDQPRQTIDLGAQSQWKNLRSSIGLGVDHIETGPDHVLFVAVLLLPSVLVWLGTGWKPVDRFGRSLWRVLKIVSMFTIAHSITFSAAGLGWINIEDFTLVEIIIALSITIAALHNLRPIFGEREWLLAFGFGLFHGLGFASLVSGLEVSRTTQLVSLLGRNIGIEIGQIVVVLVTFPSLWLLRRTRFYRPFFIAASITLALISFFWFLERAFEIDDFVSRYVNEILEFPRAWWWVAGFFVLCGALFAVERAGDRLLPVADAEE